MFNLGDVAALPRGVRNAPVARHALVSTVFSTNIFAKLAMYGV